MAKKIYAVRKGRIPGIYTSWPECKKQVDGYSGAEYKSFDTVDAQYEAENYLQNITSNKKTSSENNPFPNDRATANAYVDGSYDEITNRYAYGCIIFHETNEYTFSKAYEPNDASSMRNVAGEITGSLVAMKWCLKKDIKTLHLYYDYEGIEKWCTGLWKTKNPHTQKYKNYYDQYTAQGLKVIFHKVKGHSGNKYNEKADKLARQALGL